MVIDKETRTTRGYFEDIPDNDGGGDDERDDMVVVVVVLKAAMAAMEMSEASMKMAMATSEVISMQRQQGCCPRTLFPPLWT